MYWQTRKKKLCPKLERTEKHFLAQRPGAYKGGDSRLWNSVMELNSGGWILSFFKRHLLEQHWTWISFIRSVFFFFNWSPRGIWKFWARDWVPPSSSSSSSSKAASFYITVCLTLVEPPGTKGTNGISSSLSLRSKNQKHQYRRAGEDGTQAVQICPYSAFWALSGLDGVHAYWWSRSSLLILLILMLISPRNTLTDTFRNVLSAICIPFSAIKLTQKTNHHT